MRATSTTVTCSITWSLPRIVSALITAPFVATPPSPETPTNAFAMSTACCASDGGRDQAGQEHGVAGRAHLDLRLRHRGAKGLAEDVEVSPDIHLERRDLPALGIHHEDGRCAVVHADDEELPRRADDGVGDLWIGDEDLLRISRQIDDQGPADGEVDLAGQRLLGGGDGQDRGIARRPAKTVREAPAAAAPHGSATANAE